MDIRGRKVLNSLFYNIKQGFVQIFRNRGMSLASIFSIVAMLLILGLFFVITVNINLFTEVVKQDYDQVEVFLLDKTTKTDAQQLMSEIEKQEGVSGVEYRSTDDALKILGMIMLSGDAVDCMAAAKNKIRKVVSMLDKEVKTDG